MKYGFVYIWFDRKHKRYYVGCRWGSIDDGYICSSSWMKASYKKRPQDFKRRIISMVYTNRKDLLEEEYRWLSMMKEEELKGNRYYNLQIRHFNHWSTDESKRKTIGKKISDKNKNNPKLKVSRPVSLETRKKISDTLKGKPLGYTRSEETRNKISENSKRLQKEQKIGMGGRNHNKETLELMSKNNAMKNHKYRDKIGEANRGTKGLWLNGIKKMAKPGTDKWNDLISKGYRPVENV